MVVSTPLEETMRQPPAMASRSMQGPIFRACWERGARAERSSLLREIPAHAGKLRISSQKVVRERAHPRACGALQHSRFGGHLKKKDLSRWASEQPKTNPTGPPHARRRPWLFGPHRDSTTATLWVVQR